MTSSPETGDVSRILEEVSQGKREAAGELLPIVYEELRRLAARKMVQEKPGQTLNATALVHEAYLRLLGPEQIDQDLWEGRKHFFAAAAEAMRRILIEAARRKGRVKHGGERKQVPLDDVASVERSEELLALDEALTKLAEKDPEAAEVVKLRYFVGMSVEEAAEALGVSRATANRQWAYARAWLKCELSDSASS